MSVEKLGSTSAIVAALRAELSRRSERGSGLGGKDSPRTDKRSASDIQALREQLADIVESIPENDFSAVRAVRPRLVRAILLWELGPALRDHPDWQPMLESICLSLDSHPRDDAAWFQLVSDLKR